MKACSNLEVQQLLTGYNIQKGNAETVRMIRTMTEKQFLLM